ncbi:hypothetical protein TB2_034177 [Malus domestica]
MGWTSSKLDDLPAVTLCQEHCGFLDEAIHQRYVFAEAIFKLQRPPSPLSLSLKFQILHRTHCLSKTLKSICSAAISSYPPLSGHQLSHGVLSASNFTAFPDFRWSLPGWPFHRRRLRKRRYL